jgi:hypothetical protein
MSTDWKELCAELLSYIDDLDEEHWLPGSIYADRARTALAQPEPEGPRDDGEIDDEAAVVIPWLLEEAALAANSDAPYAAGKLTLAAQLLGERRPTIKPVPVAERPWEREGVV